MEASENTRATGAGRAPVIRVMDTHVEGEPARLVLDAADLLAGASPAERRADLLSRQQWIRTSLVCEPRGHRDMFGVVLVPPADPAADIGAVFMEHEGCPKSCGHGTVALVSAIVERGLVPGLPAGDAVVVETPGGLVTVDVERDGDGALRSVVLHQPPMRVAGRPRLPHPGRPGEAVRTALVRGPSWVLLVEEAELGVEIATAGSDSLLELVRGLRVGALDWLASGPPGLDGDAREAAESLRGSPIAITGRPVRPDCSVRTFVGFAERSVDRSPCGTAVSALVALLASEGRLAPGVWQGVESVTGGRFEFAVAPDAGAGSGWFGALVRGRGYVTGTAEFEFAEGDRLSTGFSI